MSKINRTITVCQIPGEVGRYHVESWSKQGFPNLVDLLALEGNGECSCIDFQGRCRDNFLSNGGKIVPYLTFDGLAKDRTQCKHIEAARRFLLNRIIERMRKAFP